MSSEELASRLCKAIRERRIVRFHYEGGNRTVEPYAYGTTASGEECLAGYQTGGYSTRSELSGWWFYEVSKIEGLIITERVAGGLRPGYPTFEMFERVFACVRSRLERRLGMDRRKKQIRIDFPDRRKGGDGRRAERRTRKDRREGNEG
jgi:hypothetical protein